MTNVSQHSELIAAAARARERAHAPYSKFAVGAAVLTQRGNVFSGCNVENISFGLTMCAERVCVGAAIASGDSGFREIAIVSDSGVPVAPCGACRQVLAEFAPDLLIISATVSGLIETNRLGILLPNPATEF